MRVSVVCDVRSMRILTSAPILNQCAGGNRGRVSQLGSGCRGVNASFSQEDRERERGHCVSHVHEWAGCVQTHVLAQQKGCKPEVQPYELVRTQRIIENMPYFCHS